MAFKDIRWHAALGGAIVAEVALVAASILWVTLYSYLLHPDQPLAVYQAHAQASGPWVSIVAGLPVFYAIGRWLLREWPTLWAGYGLYLALDTGILLALSPPSVQLPLLLVTVSYFSKLLAVIAGQRQAAQP